MGLFNGWRRVVMDFPGGAWLKEMILAGAGGDKGEAESR
jgi:hypothetical protein